MSTHGLRGAWLGGCPINKAHDSGDEAEWDLVISLMKERTGIYLSWLWGERSPSKNMLMKYRFLYEEREARQT